MTIPLPRIPAGILHSAHSPLLRLFPIPFPICSAGFHARPLRPGCFYGASPPLEGQPPISVGPHLPRRVFCVPDDVAERAVCSCYNSLLITENQLPIRWGPLPLHSLGGRGFSPGANHPPKTILPPIPFSALTHAPVISTGMNGSSRFSLCGWRRPPAP
jgi:hypothetical protein